MASDVSLGVTVNNKNPLAFMGKASSEIYGCGSFADSAF
jgi:hypothetical protein